jgi:RNA polymerase sigma factor (sigma-70 family)
MPTEASTADRSGFLEFVERSEAQLRRALVASFGPEVGREAALDALAWGWEHWSRLQAMDNPVGYLYRVGRSNALRQLRSRPHALLDRPLAIDNPNITPELLPALGQLSEQQRAAVVLVHGYAMSQRHVAAVLGIAVSTLREHLARGLERLRTELKDGSDG